MAVFIHLITLTDLELVKQEEKEGYIRSTL